MSTSSEVLHRKFRSPRYSKDTCPIVGFDNIDAVQELIKQDKVLATIDQFGPEMAANAINDRAERSNKSKIRHPKSKISPKS